MIKNRISSLKQVKKIAKKLNLNIGRDCYSADTIMLLATRNNIGINKIEALVLQGLMSDAFDKSL